MTLLTDVNAPLPLAVVVARVVAVVVAVVVVVVVRQLRLSAMHFVSVFTSTTRQFCENCHSW